MKVRQLAKLNDSIFAVPNGRLASVGCCSMMSSILVEIGVIHSQIQAFFVFRH